MLWVLVLATMVTIASLWGGDFKDDFVAPGTETAAAVSLLEERFPGASGTSAVVVFKTVTGTLQDPVAAAAINESMSRIVALPHVGLITDPLTTPGAVSADGTIARADVFYDKALTEVGRDGAEGLIEALDPARDAGLQGEAGGELIMFLTQPETGTSELVGVAVAMLILLVVFGTAAAALIPVVTAVVSIVVGTSLLTALAAIFDISGDAPVIATMIGLGVGIDYTLLILARYREYRKAGRANSDALSAAMATAGGAVVFAGGTVVVALLGLVFVGVGSLTSVGIATSIVVTTTVLAALTLAPAVLSLLGDRIDSLHLYKARSSRGTSFWWRWSHHVTHRPWPYLIGATALLVVLAVPAFALNLGYVDSGSEPESTTQRQAFDIISEGFGPGFNGPLTLVVDLTETDDPEQAIASITEEVLADPGILTVAAPIPSPGGDTLLIVAIPTTAPSDFDTADTVHRLREAIDEDYVYVAGATPALIDLADHMATALPRFIGAVLVMSFILLAIVFRSVLVPLKAVIMNILAIAAAWGVMVAVFQWGWGLGLIGLSHPIPIISFVPIMLFAILFGLSMDYEVFLLSRIREEWIRTGDGHESVAMGLVGTGRVITSAAAIMIAVFLAFVITPAPILKMIGLVLAAAVLIDATIIRMVLVPSAMALMGRANWWLPKWLDRILPTIYVEAEEPVVSVQSEVAGIE